MKRGTELLILTIIIGLAIVVSGYGLVTEVQTASQHFKGGEDKVVKIGLIAPLSGDAKILGTSTENAIKLAFEQCDYKAGSCKIEYVAADDQNDPVEAGQVARKLIFQDKVDCIIGSVNSTPSLEIADLAQKNHVVQLSCTASDPKLTINNGQRKTYFFRTCFNDLQQGQGAAKFALNELKAKTAAVLFGQENASSQRLADAFQESFTVGGGKVKYMAGYSQQDFDFSDKLKPIAEADVDLIYLPDNYRQAALISQQARHRGIDVPLLGGDNWDSPYLDLEKLEGSYFTTHYPPSDQKEAMQTFIRQYKEKYGREPDTVAMLTYDGVNLLLEAIKRADSSDHDRIRASISATKRFQGVGGNWAMGSNGDPIRAIRVIKIQSGKRVLSAHIAS